MLFVCVILSTALSLFFPHPFSKQAFPVRVEWGVCSWNDKYGVNFSVADMDACDLVSETHHNATHTTHLMKPRRYFVTLAKSEYEFTQSSPPVTVSIGSFTGTFSMKPANDANTVQKEVT